MIENWTPSLPLTSTHQRQGYTFTFLRERALWIPELKTLLIADLHFGKASHFRKSGIPIPEPIHALDLIRLESLHQDLRPVHTYFLGDLFHSVWNEQWEILNQFLEQFGGTQFHLVLGNHDILSPAAYRQSILRIHEKPLTIGKLILSHEPMEVCPTDLVNICGHIHPGVLLKGKARQAVRIPCFHWSGQTLILPSFGNFTGMALIQPKESDQIWGISSEKVFPVLSGTSIG